MITRIGLAVWLCIAVSVYADDPATASKPASSEPPASDVADAAAPVEGGAEAPAFVLSDEVHDALLPLFSMVAKAEVSRATVEMLTNSLVGGSVVDSQKSTFQIASQVPNKFTVYLKDDEQRTRLFNDGQSLVVAVGTDAYIRFPAPISPQDAVTSLPIPMGPYPEPLLALTLAGVDPAISLLGGMKSIEIVDREDFRGKSPAIHFRGIQADAVTWDLWIARDEPKPLRLLVDLTPMLLASDEGRLPENYSYQVRFDFLAWRMSGEVEDGIFAYTPPKEAKEHASLQAYYESLAGVAAEHPLLGQPAPGFTATALDGEPVDLEDLRGKVVVLDFWATWCAPCLAAIPVLKEVTDGFADKDVILLALNTGEQKAEIEEFLKQQPLDVGVLLDPDGKVAEAYRADAIPQTVIIGKDGTIESVHVGFLGVEALQQRLKDELEVLSVGGKIASVAEASSK